MIIDFISDLHGSFPTLDGGDLLICAGDVTARDTFKQNEEFIEWLVNQDYNKIILIGGNHDNYREDNPIDYIFNMHYLCDSGLEYCGYKIWGAPWTKTFGGMNPHCKAFTFDYDAELDAKWDLIPSDTNILVTHSPPFGVLDAGFGCMKLEKHVKERVKPLIHVFGHIHEFGGMAEQHDDINFINAAYMDRFYRPLNKVVRVEL